MSDSAKKRPAPARGLGIVAIMAAGLMLPSHGGNAAPYEGGDFQVLQASQGGGGFAVTGTPTPVFAARGISGNESGAELTGGTFSLRPGVRGVRAVERGDAWVIH